MTRNYRGGFFDEAVVFEGGHHEQGKVHAARHVAGENGITDMSPPDREALGWTFFEITAAHDGPASLAGEHAAARFNLIVQITDA